ncbi:MAG: tRNA (guanosine(37)-N1)-methyltransferase TrmD [Candidatus Binatia bacterium]
MAFDVLTLFPEFVEFGTRVGVLGRAIDAGILAVRAHQLRDYTGGSPHPLDDSPYGGGPGMVMRAEPVYAAVEDVSARFAPKRRILLTPQGSPFTQASARRLACDYDGILLFCGRYEGVDERVRPLFDEEISIGDYVLTGGEIGALVIIDAVSRLVPGVLGSADSHASESFSDPSLLEYPQYTRPADFRGMTVPPVLTSGNHAEIERWRREQARARTESRRPDLFLSARRRN